MAGLHFDITGDNSNFMRKLHETENGVKNTSKQIEESGGSIEAMFNRMTKAAAAFGAGLTAKEIVSNIVKIRGEFQQLEVAFTTMLGSEEKAGTLMQQFIKTAATTPFDLQSIANGGKQLLAYGFAADEVNSTLIRLGDIAAGLSIPLNDLVWLYGTTMTQGRLFTMDLRQFMSRGIPLADELAKQFGVTKDKVGELVTAGKVGFPQVQKAIEAMTSEGGKFGGLMEKQSHTITGQISNIEDSIDVMFNNIGKSSEGLINEILSGVSYAVENYEEIGKTLLELTAAYGAYKAVLITITALQRVNTAVMEQAVLEKKLAAAANIVLSDSEAVAAASTKLFTGAIRANTAALLSNPVTLAAAAVVALGYGIYKLYTYQTDAQKAQEKLNDAYKEAEKASLSEERELANLKGQLAALTKGSAEYNAVKDKIVKGFGKYYDGLEAEIDKVGLTEQAYRKLTDAITKSFGARQYNKFKQEQTDQLDSTMADNLDKLHKRLIDKLGEESGSYFYTKIREGIVNGTLKAGHGFNIDGIDNNTQKALDITSGAYSNDIIQYKKAEEYILNILKAQKLAKEVDQKARIHFGIEDTNSKKSPVSEQAKQFDDVNKKVKETTASISKLKKEISDLRSGKTKAGSGKLEDEIEQKEKELKTLRGTYKTLTGDDISDSALDKAKKSTEKYNILLSKQAIEEKRAVEDLQNEVDQTRINAMDNGSKRTIAQMELNFEKEMQTIDRAKEDALRKKVDNARSAFETNPKNKGKTFDASNITLSDDEITKFNEKYKATILAFNKDKNEQSVSELQMMWDYLKEYGTFQQKKLAIAQEYDEKIAKADNDWQKKSLEKQKSNAIGNVDLEAVKQNVDWSSVFGNFSSMLDDEMKRNLEALREYMQTSEFKQMPANDQSTIVNAVEQLQDKVGGDFGGFSLKEIGKLTNEYQGALQRSIAAKNNEILAYDVLKSAQEKLTKALGTGNKAEIESAKIAVDMAKKNASNSSNAVQATNNEFTAAGNNLKSATEKSVTAIESLTSAVSQIKSGSLSNAYDGIKNLSSTLSKTVGGSIGQLLGTISSAMGGGIGQIVSAALGLLDLLKDGVGSLISNLLDMIYNAVNGILSDLFSGDILLKPLESLKNGIGNILNTVTFGGFGSWTSSSNAKEVAETTERLTSSNEILKQSIDALKDEMEKARGADTVKVYDETVKKQKELIENTGDILAVQMGYHGAHHSNSHYINQSLSDSDWQRISDKVGSRVTDMSGLWNLSPEDLKKVSTLTDIWDKIYNGGKYDKSDYIDQYLELAGTLEDLETQLNETLTQVKFDDVYDNFIDTLMDMDASAEDFADNISEYFMRAMLSNQIGKEYADKLEDWYKTFAEDMKDGTLSDDELIALKEEYMGYVEEAIKERDALAQATGYDSSSSSSQSATSKTYESWSQTDADEVSGRFTALQITGEQIKSAMLSVLSNISLIVSTSSDNNVILSEIKNIMILSNSHLEDISKFTKNLIQIKADIAEVKNNTKSLSSK